MKVKCLPFSKKGLIGVHGRLMFQQGQPQRCVGHANCFSSFAANLLWTAPYRVRPTRLVN
jgi:hypothetical protein